MKTIQQLENEYALARHALSDYRLAAGFEPGVRVVCKFRDEPEKRGVIAPYGEAWQHFLYWCVPVILDLGYTQPWMMSNLTLETPAQSQP